MQDCKSQILLAIPNSTCCSQTFINIVFLTSAQIDKYKNLILISSNSEIINKTQKIINKLYPDIISYEWDRFLMLKGNIYSILADVNYENSLNLSYFDNECDKLTILKTLFAVSGGFYYNQDNNKNSKGYDFEIVLKDEKLAILVLELFKEFGFELKLLKRQSAFVVYTKNSTTICDILVKLGATYSALEVQNNLAVREMRNSANRQNNCFASNLEKTLTASEIQLKAIKFLMNNEIFETLDENLKEVALCRLANPEATLQELQVLTNNKLSRAGLKYRLDKIVSIYKKLKGEK